jgi:acyl-coenzyme A synthetase/AMP-(fatty) acid ligase
MDEPRIAAGLEGRGLGKGEVGGLSLLNCPEFAGGVLGSAPTRGVNPTLNPLLGVDETAVRLADSSAYLVMTTNDLAGKVEDAANRLPRTLVDWIKDGVKYHAYQVAPADLQAVLNGHPSVTDRAVVPSKDPESGEAPKALVVRKPGALTTSERLTAFVAGRVSPTTKVQRPDFCDQLPASASGTILRRLLVECGRAEEAP